MDLITNELMRRLIILRCLLIAVVLWMGGMRVSAQPATDDANLINIDNLEQLNAIRYDLDGDGTPSTGNESAYRTAFGLSGTNNNTCTPDPCQGYELMNNLDFNDTRLYTVGKSNCWTPTLCLGRERYGTESRNWRLGNDRRWGDFGGLV